MICFVILFLRSTCKGSTKDVKQLTEQPISVVINLEFSSIELAFAPVEYRKNAIYKVTPKDTLTSNTFKK
jgi:hypothetical protein